MEGRPFNTPRPHDNFTVVRNIIGPTNRFSRRPRTARVLRYWYIDVPSTQFSRAERGRAILIRGTSDHHRSVIGSSDEPAIVCHKVHQLSRCPGLPPHGMNATPSSPIPGSD